MDGFRHVIRAERTVYLLGDERDERRGGLREGHQHVVKRGVGLGLVAVVLTLPETAAAEADVPVREVLDERFEPVRGGLQLVLVHVPPDLVDHVRQAGKDPAVERIRGILRGGERTRRGLPVVDVRVGHEERERVPDRQDHAAHGLLHGGLGEFQVFRADHLRTQQDQTERVGAVGVHDLHRVGVVAETFRHLLAVLGQHHAVHHHMHRRRLVEERAGEDRECVEPAAGLILPLGDELGREAAVEVFLVLEGIVFLSVRHGAALEPAVEHLRHAFERRARSGLDGHAVHEMLVDVGDFLPGQLLEFGHGAHADRLAGLLVAPDRQRAAPVTVPADGPVAGVLQPLAEAPLLDVGGHPGHLGIGAEHLLLDRVDLHEPRGDRTIDERGIVAPAVRIIVLDGAAMDELALGFQAGHDVRVGVLHITPRVVRDVLREPALGVDGADPGHAVGRAGDGVVFAETRRDMHDAGAVLGAHVVGADHAERAFGRLVLEIREERGVTQSGEVGALIALQDLRHSVGLVIRMEPGLGQDELVVAVLHLHVVDVGTGREGHVRRQRPRRGRPGQDAGLRVVFQAEPDGDGRVGDFLVALVRLEVRQRGGAARAVRQDLVALVDQALVPQLAEHPPDGLHVVHVHRAVAVAEIHPTAHALHDGLPLFRVTQHDAAAGLVELVDAVVLDLLLAGQLQLLLHLVFDRQAVAVPAERPLAVFAAHGLVARDHVLDGAGEDVPVVGQTGGEGRAVVEQELGVALAVLHGLLEDAVLFPEGQVGRFDGGEFGFARNCFEHRSKPLSV